MLSPLRGYLVGGTSRGLTPHGYVLPPLRGYYVLPSLRGYYVLPPLRGCYVEASDFLEPPDFLSPLLVDLLSLEPLLLSLGLSAALAFL